MLIIDPPATAGGANSSIIDPPATAGGTDSSKSLLISSCNTIQRLQIESAVRAAMASMVSEGFTPVEVVNTEPSHM